MAGRNVLLLLAVAVALGVGLWAVAGGDAPAPPADEATADRPDQDEAPPPEPTGAAARPRSLDPADPAVQAALPGVVADEPALAEPAEPPGPPAVPFQDSPAASDFRTPAPAGHEPEAMRKVAEALSAWTQRPENADAAPRFLGVDCREPPCVMSAQFNADRDPTFLQRSQDMVNAKANVGTSTTLTHLLSRDEQRTWTFWNPHPPASAGRHAFEQRAIARIQAEIKDLPTYNPSAELR